MKLVSVVIPTYNEKDNVELLCNEIIAIFASSLSNYDYEIILIDNHSSDGTREIIENICGENKNIKAIFNAKNFGQIRSPVYGLKQAFGDCVIRISADFQEPVLMIPEFIKEWENGWKIVIGVKESSEESSIMYFFRSIYYKLFKLISDVDHISHFTGFGLFDKQFVDIVRNINDPLPYLRGIIAELGFDYKSISYRQNKRRAGKSKNNFFTLYDYAMIGITSYSKVVMRLATFTGFLISGLSFLIGFIYLVLKLIYWDRFQAGSAPILIGVFFFSAIQLFFIGIMGEYLMNINIRVMNRPLVIEEKRLNF